MTLDADNTLDVQADTEREREKTENGQCLPGLLLCLCLNVHVFSVPLCTGSSIHRQSVDKSPRCLESRARPFFWCGSRAIGMDQTYACHCMCLCTRVKQGIRVSRCLSVSRCLGRAARTCLRVLGLLCMYISTYEGPVSCLLIQSMDTTTVATKIVRRHLCFSCIVFWREELVGRWGVLTLPNMTILIALYRVGGCCIETPIAGLFFFLCLSLSCILLHTPPVVGCIREG